MLVVVVVLVNVFNGFVFVEGVVVLIDWKFEVITSSDV